MGFLDKLRHKKNIEQNTEQPKQETSAASGNQQQKRIKRYTSEGKPVYE